MTIMQALLDKCGKVSQANRRGRHNPWVLSWFVLVAAVLTANVIMIVLAIVTNPGLVVNDYYEQGRAYEQHVLQRIAARHALNWDLNMELPRRVVVAVPASYGIKVADAKGLPLRGAEVELAAYRPSDVHADFTTVLQETAPGHYQAELSLPLKGVWDLTVQIKHGTDSNDISRRISVQMP